jgi:hypothetical protein
LKTIKDEELEKKKMKTMEEEKDDGDEEDENMVEECEIERASDDEVEEDPYEKGRSPITRNKGLANKDKKIKRAIGDDDEDEPVSDCEAD